MQRNRYGLVGFIVLSHNIHLSIQGLSKGTKIPPLGQVQVSWFTGHLPSNPQQETQPALSNSTEDKDQAHSPLHGEPLSPHIQEEEVVASGWGGTGDDGDGMGML
jgi:RNA-binding protein 26